MRLRVTDGVMREFERDLEKRNEMIISLYEVYLSCGRLLSQTQVARAISGRVDEEVSPSSVRAVLMRHGYDTGAPRRSRTVAAQRGKEEIDRVIGDYAAGRLKLRHAKQALQCSAATVKRFMDERGLKTKRGRKQ